MNFVNLTPYTAEVLDPEGDLIRAVKPSGKVGLATGTQVLNVPPPSAETAYIVLPAVSDASDRDDLVSIKIDEADRTNRGNVRTHVCYWSGA